jgi:hypothetical protein
VPRRPETAQMPWMRPAPGTIPTSSTRVSPCVPRPDAQAVDFKHLLDRPGSGDVTPLGAAALKQAGITFTGRRYASKRAGSTVITGWRPLDRRVPEEDGHRRAGGARQVVSMPLWRPSRRRGAGFPPPRSNRKRTHVRLPGVKFG